MENNSKSLVVVMPVCKTDNSEYFREAVSSCLNDLYNLGDLLIVCDGPLNFELDSILNDFVIQNCNIIIERLENNQGLPSALNHGIRCALKLGYEYVARMDADDIVIRGRFHKQIEKLKFTQSDFCSSNVKFIDKSGGYLFDSSCVKTVSVKSLLKKCSIVHPSVMFHRRFFSKFGFYDTALLKSQDLELWLRAISKDAKYILLDDFLLCFRYDSNIALRRKYEQRYNIEIKRKYIENIFQYRFLFVNYFVLFMPAIFCLFLLKLKR